MKNCNKLKQIEDFNGDTIQYYSFNRELIAIGDLKEIVKPDGRSTRDEYDMIFCKLGQNKYIPSQKRHSAVRVGNLFHFLAGHMGVIENYESDFYKLHLYDPKEIVNFIFKVASSQKGVEVNPNLHRIAYKLNFGRRIEYLIIGLGKDKSIYTTFIADDDLREELNDPIDYPEFQNIDPFIVER